MKRQIAECKKCDHVWLPRATTEKPRICPNCKSARWDVGPLQPKTPKERGNENRGEKEQSRSIAV